MLHWQASRSFTCKGCVHTEFVVVRPKTYNTEFAYITLRGSSTYIFLDISYCSVRARLGSQRPCARFPWKMCVTPVRAGTGGAATSPPSADTPAPARSDGKVGRRPFTYCNESRSSKNIQTKEKVPL